MKYFLTVLIAAVLLGIPSRMDAQDPADEQTYKHVWELIEIEQLNKAIGIAMPLAKQGDAKYQHALGYIYTLFRKGKEALYWYGKAAAQDYANAQFNIAYLHNSEEGQRCGVTQDVEEAKKWYRATLENTTDRQHDGARGDAAIVLAGLYKNEGDTEAARDVLQEAVDAGIKNNEVPYLLASDYYDRDDRAAFRLYRIAAEGGNAKAQYELAGYFKNGKFVDEDIKEATKWYQRAADQDYAPALSQLGECYERLYNKTLDERDLRKALKYYYKSEQDPNIKIFRVKNAPKDGKMTPEFFNAWAEGKNQEDSGLLSLYKQGVMGARKYKTYAEWEKNVVAKLAIDSDVDINIPEPKSGQNSNTFALIIANENYDHEEYVPYAENDGTVFAKYCQKTLDVPEENIHTVHDAGLNRMKWEIDWLKQNITSGNATKVIFYYVGHGMPAENQLTSFLLPTDGFAKSESSALNIKEVFDNLSSQRVEAYIILDACFSGAKRNGGMLVESRGVAIKSKEVAPEGKMVVLSACQGNETAESFADQRHGLFTYYVLKSLQASKGTAPLGELFAQVKANVEKTSVAVNKKSQTPSVNVSKDMPDWAGKKL